MSFNDRLAAAIKYLSETDLASLEIGRHDINEGLYLLRQSYNSKPSDACRFETHEKYVDIQWIISGEEAIEVTAREGAVVTEAYNPERDVQFYATPTAPVSRVVVKAGCYMTLFPDMVHRAGLAEGASVPIEKVVAKVRLSDE